MNRREIILAGGATAILGVPETKADAEIQSTAPGLAINAGWATFTNTAAEDAKLCIHFNERPRGPYEIIVPAGGYIAVSAKVLEGIVAAEWRVI